MRMSVVLSLAVGALLSFAAPPCRFLFANPGQDAQTPEREVPRRPVIPPDFGDKGPPQSGPRTPRYDPAQAHRDAQQLAALAQKVSLQVDEISKNALPKDLMQNLKEIQKLAKRLRAEVSP